MKSKLSSLLILSITFIVFTVIGTLSHEYGHILVAKYLGYETELHYGSMNYDNNLQDQINEIYFRNETSILKGKPFPEKELHEKLIRKSFYNKLAITIGGPVQTILTGTIGFILLLFRRKKNS